MIPPEQLRQVLELLADGRRLAFEATRDGTSSIELARSNRSLTRWMERCDEALGPMMQVHVAELPDDVALFTDTKTGRIKGMIYNMQAGE